MKPPLLLATLALALVTGASALGQTSKRVLMIGVDGAGGQYVPEAATPNLDALAADGAVRFDYFNEGGMTTDPPEGYGASGVNWSTIVTGASAENHGVVDNSFSGSNFDEHPHFFQHVKEFDSGLYTASLANWTPINTFITPDEYADLEIGYDAGDLFTQDAAVKTDAVNLLQTGDPDVMFLHFDQVDGAGHSFSWGSPEHIASIQVVDGLIGEVMTALNARPGVVSGDEDWLVLLSADHGAARGEFSHVASQGEENWEVPFYVSGPSVEDGVAIGKGSLRDLATTALWHLGIDPLEAGLDGSIRGLTIEPPTGIEGDINGDGIVSGNGLGPAATDDVTAFVDHWLVEGDGSIADRYARGDLNLDGITDLGDWLLLTDLDPSMGEAVGRRLTGVPEPSAAALLLVVGLVTRLNRFGGRPRCVATR